MNRTVYVGVPGRAADVAGGIAWIVATIEQLDFTGADVTLEDPLSLPVGTSVFLLVPGTPLAVIPSRVAAGAQGVDARLAFGRLDERDQAALRARRSALGEIDGT